MSAKHSLSDGFWLWLKAQLCFLSFKHSANKSCIKSVAKKISMLQTKSCWPTRFGFEAFTSPTAKISKKPLRRWRVGPKKYKKIAKMYDRTGPQVVNWLKISDRAKFGAHSRTGIEFLGSNYNGILLSTLASNCTLISSELSKLVHSKTWHFTLTQPFPRDFWLPVHWQKPYLGRLEQGSLSSL